jgi:hypothetical protein
MTLYVYYKNMEGEERVEDTEEWQEMAKSAAMDIGLTEDEAELAVEDYVNGY